jgi:hypothetical protein
MIARLRTVAAILEQIGRSRPVRKSELRSGDHLRVTTENSVYSIRVLPGAVYSVSGGWFDRQGASPTCVSIAGCTWGGSVIRNDIIAACGLHIEFGNRVVTSKIREVRLIRDPAEKEPPLPPARSVELLSACYGAAWRGASAG